MGFLAAAGAVFGIGAGLAVCFAGNYLSFVIKQARDSYVVYRLSSERDELRATKDRLERELALVRAENTNVDEFKAAVKIRLDELNSVVEASTAMGLLKREKTADAPILAKKGTSEVEPKDNVLASLLDAPELAPRSARGRRTGSRKSLDASGSKNTGLGGAEIECVRNRNGALICSSNASKEDVSYNDMRASLTPPVSPAIDERKWDGEQGAVLERLAHYTNVLKALPIGSPVGGDVTSGFGYRVSPFSHRSSFHEGMDISLESGKRIRCPGEGTVVKVEYDGTYGWMIDVAHTPTLTTRYAHLSRAMVKEGQRVHRGQVLALGGSTGRSTGPHLHYEIRVNGRAKNPRPFVALADKLASLNRDDSTQS